MFVPDLCIDEPFSTYSGRLDHSGVSDVGNTSFYVNDEKLGKRLLFYSVQVMSNDLSRGLFPAREVKLLIVDEAHKATGDYAYCQVARELFRSKVGTTMSDHKLEVWW